VGVIDTLLKWVAPFLDPMQVFQTHAQEMNGVHSNSLQSFRTLVYKLDPGQALQQNTIISGDFANAITNTGLDFTQTELDLSETALEINKLYQLSQSFAECVNNIMDAIEIASAKLEGEEVLTEITADVDIAAVAEGGFNPIADILGLILTVIDGALIISTIKDLAEAIYQDIQGLKADLTNLRNAIYPPTAPAPSPGQTPGWQTNPKPYNPSDVTALLKQYGGYFPGQIPALQTTIINLMKMGMTKDQIDQIMNALLGTGCSPNDILLFLQGLTQSDGADPNSPTPAQIVARILSLSRGSPNQPNLKNLVTQYAQIASIPGAGRLLERLMTASWGPSYDGYNYELKWCVAHKDQIARIEDVFENEKGQIKQAADVVMKSGPFTKGAIVDTKSYKPGSLSAQMSELLTQIQGDKDHYPGYPIVLVFDSKKLLDSNGQLLPGVEDNFKTLAGAGATIMTSPPDKVWYVGQEDLPGAHTNPTRLLQSGANVVAGAIEAGQPQSQPQLPPGQTNPPQELPPMEMPPQQ
jgi:hypothetical protein